MSSSTDESEPVTDPEDGRLVYADVRLRFDSLVAPSQGSQLAYATEPLGPGIVRLGKSQSGSPCLILTTQSSVSHQDSHFANLRLRHGLRLRLRTNDDLSTYSVLECVSEDVSVRDWFLRLVPSLHAKLAEASQLESVQDLVANLAELFRLIDRDAHRSLTGLWGELALITASDDPTAAALSWHVSGDATHDFTSQGAHVEVKASELGRKHHFSPAQLQPEEQVLVASLLLEQSDDGSSVLDLYDEALELLEARPDLQQKVHELVIACVGRRLSTAEDSRFDLPTALASARYVIAGLVPQLREPFPAGVSEVRFTADLSGCQQADAGTLANSALWTNLAASQLRRS
jgi:urease gamma subunit